MHCRVGECQLPFCGHCFFHRQTAMMLRAPSYCAYCRLQTEKRGVLCSLLVSRKKEKKNLRKKEVRAQPGICVIRFWGACVVFVVVVVVCLFFVCLFVFCFVVVVVVVACLFFFCVCKTEALRMSICVSFFGPYSLRDPDLFNERSGQLYRRRKQHNYTAKCC